MTGMILLLAALMQPVADSAAPEGRESMDALTSRVFEVAAAQSILMAESLGENEFPRTVNPEDGSLVKSGDTWWCSGFFPGVLWEIYDYSRDLKFAEAAAQQTEKLSGLLEKTTDHDIGFMIGCSYGNGYRLTGNADYLPVLEKAAGKLAARFSDRTGVIKSWNFGSDRGWKYPVIIDNMMNLELLLDTWRWFGADSLADIAVRHAQTTLKNHFREDGGSYHLVDYDPEDGAVRMRITHQGAADSTTWARGEAWGLYGYVMMYLHIGQEAFLLQAEKIAGWVMAHLPGDGIPYWDYSQTDLKDASAAAVMASAFVQLYQVTGAPEYLEVAEREIRTLASAEYLAEPGTNGGFILKHSVGSLPGHSEVDVPLTYADYYFLEALNRYRRATAHPRLFADDRDFDVLKKKIETVPGSDVSLLHRRITEAVAADDRAPLKKEFDASHRRILSVSQKALSRIFSNAYVYRFTGDTACLHLAERTINEVCDFDGWNPSHFLDVAEMAFAVSVGYDWLYHHLRPETLRKAEKAVRDFAFTAALDTSDAWFYRRQHNWNQVCNAGMMTAAVAFREDCGTGVRGILLNGAVSNRVCVEAIYSPSGGYGEGPGYWNYGTMFQCVLNSMLDYSLGADFGLSEVTGFDRTGEYVLRCYGAAHRMFNYYDNGVREYPSHPLWHFASRFRNPSMVINERQFLRAGDYQWNRLMPLVALWAGDVQDSSVQVPKGKVYAVPGVTPIITARGDWTSTESDWYLGFKGGQADSNHGHIDGGSFVFDAFGYRWVSDPGSTNYADIEVKLRTTGGDYWDRSQNSQRWDVYPMNNDYHSVMTVDGRRFNVSGKGEILEVYDVSGCWGGKIDTTPYYSDESGTGYLNSAARAVFTDGSSLTVIDEVDSPGMVPLRWTLVTETEVTLHGKYAVLTQGDKSMRLKLTGARGCRYAVRDCPEGAAKGFTFIDITFTVPAGTSVVTATLIPELTCMKTD